MIRRLMDKIMSIKIILKELIINKDFSNPNTESRVNNKIIKVKKSFKLVQERNKTIKVIKVK
jgi:hypothetical protein